MRMKAWLVAAIFTLISWLPLSAARKLGMAIGRLTWWRDSRSAKVTRRNISACYPQLGVEEAEQLAYDSVLETGKLAVEIPLVWRRSGDWLNSVILKEHNLQLLKDEIARNKGVVVLAPHMGNWEVVGYQLTRFGKLACMYQPPKQPYMDKLILESRLRLGAEVLPTTPRGIAKLYKHLKRGGLTGILPDQSPEQGSGEFAPFFGISTYTMTMIHGLIQRTDCRVILSVALRVKGGFETWYLPVDDQIYSQDVIASLSAMNGSIQQAIGIAPAQYQWEYKRFRRRPESDKRNNFYS